MRIMPKFFIHNELRLSPQEVVCLLYRDAFFDGNWQKLREFIKRGIGPTWLLKTAELLQRLEEWRDTEIKLQNVEPPLTPELRETFLRNAVMETIIGYLHQTEKKLSDPNFNPHPIIKALALALRAAEDGKKDGNYMGVSGDAEQHHGVPHMLYSVVLQKLGQRYNILNVTDLMTGRTVILQIIHRIITAEIELEKFSGDNVPIDAAIGIADEAIPDMVVMKLDAKNRNAAMDYAKEMIRQKKLVGIPKDVVQRLLSTKNTSEWVKLPSEVRLAIGVAWGTKMGKSTFVITHIEEDIPKWKVRELIAFKLLGIG